VLVPLALLTLVSTQTNLFLPRYVVTVGAVLMIALALGVDGVLRDRPLVLGRAAAALLIAAVSVVSLVEIRAYFVSDAPKGANWPGLVNYLSARSTADDALLSDSIDPALEYYYDGPANIVFIPEDDPPPEDYVPSLLRERDAVFLLTGARTGPAGQYLQEYAQYIPGDTWGGVVQYRPWTVRPREIETPLAVRYGDVALLRGFTLLEDTTLLLYWEALAATDREHSVLVHLEQTPNAPPQAVLDHGVAGARVSTRTWTTGTLYRDPVALPPDLPSGTYTLYVGLYPTGAPDALLPVSGAGDGRHPVATLTIE
jgi:hypothetical protein